MKKVVIAIDSFKGCLTSIEAGKAAQKGVLNVFPNCNCIVLPIADGGEGILDALVNAKNAKYITAKAHNPLMELIETRYAIADNGKTALIEMAAISGLTLISQSKRNPMLTTTFGTGELIKDALDKGCRNFIVGIGGSATNDAGLGMLQALGYVFRDKNDKELGQGGQIMKDVASIDTTNVHPALKESKFTIACDVDNPFYGQNGAAYVYAAQKGADTQMIAELDSGMQSLAKIIQQTTGKDIGNYPGAGAAGGLGGAFVAFLNATLKSGIQLLLNAINFGDIITGADLIITGEGKVDKQTAMGKVPYGVLTQAKKQNIPVVIIAGSVNDHEIINKAGFSGVFSITPYPVSLDKAIQPHFAKQNITQLVAQLCCFSNIFTKKAD